MRLFTLNFKTSDIEVNLFLESFITCIVLVIEDNTASVLHRILDDAIFVSDLLLSLRNALFHKRLVSPVNLRGVVLSD
jgi:hypothetical protein